MRKLFRKVHLWLSIPFGLIITIICFTGATLVFEDEIMELCYPDRYFVKEVKATPLPLDQLMEKVSGSLPDSVTVTSVNISSDSRRFYQIGLSKPRRASVAVNQYTGEVQPRFERAGFFMTMFRMHRWLLDSMKPDGGIFWGKMIVGTSTLLFVFILISGIVVWLPRTKKAIKSRLKISVRKGWRRFWYDLHVSGGMYVMIVLLVLALTGLTWSFSWYRTGFYKVFGITMQQQTPHGQPQNQRGRGERPSPKTNYASWQQVYEELNRKNPDNRQISVSAASASVSFERMGNQRGSDRYTFDPATGEITDISLYKDQDKSMKIRGWIYSVHVGSWGGLLTRILTFIAALIGASLPLTGYYFWIKKWISRRWRKKSFTAL